MSQVIIAYQYYAPDDVISARIMTGLAEDLAGAGWQVTVLTSNRLRHQRGTTLPPSETRNGVNIVRLARPDWNPDRPAGRILSALWMIRKFRTANKAFPDADVLVIGTDPVLAATAASAWTHAKRIHWCFDLYPDAAVADGILRRNSILHRYLDTQMRNALAGCDQILNLGPGMARRLSRIAPGVPQAMITPWAPHENNNAQENAIIEREKLFHGARTAVLYSGSFGRAHQVHEVFKLIRSIPDAQLVFSVPERYHPRIRELPGFDPECMRCVPPAADEALGNRLAAADIHLVSLAPEWSGAVVPSKFFAALATGRPVLYEGAENSDIAEWIREHNVGWILDADSQQFVTDSIRTMMSTPEMARAYRLRCHSVYMEHFQKSRMTARFAQILESHCVS